MIYCVEDDSGIRELVVYSLENTGFSAKGFENGKQFFDGLDESSLPDMVLLDIMLPGEDGVSIPVSYTHLDVYKRQAHKCALPKFAEKPAFLFINLD